MVTLVVTKLLNVDYAKIIREYKKEMKTKKKRKNLKDKTTWLIHNPYTLYTQSKHTMSTVRIEIYLFKKI